MKNETRLAVLARFSKLSVHQLAVQYRRQIARLNQMAEAADDGLLGLVPHQAETFRARATQYRSLLTESGFNA